MKKRVTDFLRYIFYGSEKPKYTLKLISDGVNLSRNKILLGTVFWNDVKKIKAYKEDLLTTDRLCIEFDLGEADSVFVINEDMEGFQNLIDQISIIFQIPKESWLPRLIQPAFASNNLVIWSKDKK